MSTNDECPICGGQRFNYDRLNNAYICTTCGYVMEISINIRVDPPFQKTERKITEIKRDREMKEIKTRYKLPIEKYLDELYVEIDTISKFFPTIKEVDIQLAKKILRHYIGKSGRKIRRRKRELALSLLYLATRINKIYPLSSKDVYVVAKKLKLSIRDVRRISKDILKKLEIRIKPRYEDEEREILNKIWRELGRDKNVNNLIRKIHRAVKEKRIGVGKTKKTVMASIAYIAYKMYGYNISQDKLARIVGISSVPLRNMVKEIMLNVYIEVLL